MIVEAINTTKGSWKKGGGERRGTNERMGTEVEVIEIVLHVADKV